MTLLNHRTSAVDGITVCVDYALDRYKPPSPWLKMKDLFPPSIYSNTSDENSIRAFD